MFSLVYECAIALLLLFIPIVYKFLAEVSRL
jgi:hypothetical protein